MDAIDLEFSVPWRVPVRFARDVFAPGCGLLADLMPPACPGRPARALVWLDQGLAEADPGLSRRIAAWFAGRPAQVALAAAPIAIAGGEAAKAGWEVVERVARACAEHGLDRHSYAVVVGGGAVLDAVGLGAALVHRGVRQVRLPSTTLAQCDAGLGVKNAVNAFGQKNFLGAFAPPWAIVDDLDLLHRQDDRSWRAGLAEAVKVAAIKDGAFLRELAARAHLLAARDQATLEWAVERCARLHLAHIAGSGDPFERGSSRPLDFGHWAAHRLEVLSGHRLLHGEAVAIGVALDSLGAVRLGLLPAAEAAVILDCLADIGFALWDDAFALRDADGRRSVLRGLAHFREHLGGELSLAMPAGLGRLAEIHDLPEAVVEDALAELAARERVRVAG